MDDGRQEPHRIEAELRGLKPAAPPEGLRQRMRIERELAALRPAPASDLLRGRIARELDGDPARGSARRQPPPWIWAPVAAASVLLCGALWQVFQATAPPPEDIEQPAPRTAVAAPADRAPRLIPVTAGRYVVAAEDAGVLDTEDLGPLRITRVQSVDRVEYQQPGNERRVVVTRPREDILYTQLISY